MLIKQHAYANLILLQGPYSVDLYNLKYIDNSNMTKQKFPVLQRKNRQTFVGDWPYSRQQLGIQGMRIFLKMKYTIFWNFHKRVSEQV